MDIVVVGAGHAGGRAVEAMRASGFTGRITLVGSEQYAPYERPALSKEFLSGALDPGKMLVRPVDYYAEQQIDLRLGTSAERIIRRSGRVELSDGTSLGYDRLLLTTGARCRTLSVPNAPAKYLHYIRGFDDSIRLRTRLVPGTKVVVIGAGLIGLEVAATATQLGCSVTVIEFAAQPMARAVPGLIGECIADLHRSRGVHVLTGTSVAAIGADGDHATVQTSVDDRFPADLVVVGIGAVPNVELAKEAGIDVDDGIITDQFGRTSDPAIFAAGDVSRHFNSLLGRHIRLEAWQNAQNQAIAVGKVLAGGTDGYADVPWFWSDQFDVNIQVAGVPLEWDEIVLRGDLRSKKCTVFLLSAGRVVGGICLNNGRDMRMVKNMIADGRPRDPAMLSDAAVNLARV